jgi:hypothetical protein
MDYVSCRGAPGLIPEAFVITQPLARGIATSCFRQDAALRARVVLSRIAYAARDSSPLRPSMRTQKRPVHRDRACADSASCRMY